MITPPSYIVKIVAVLFFSGFSLFTIADDSINKIKETNTITFSYLDGEFPFSYAQADKPAGLAVDLCQSVARYLEKDLGAPGLKIEWLKVVPAARFLSVMNHHSDIECSNITKTMERQKYLLFSIPYFYASTTFVSHKANHITGIKELSGHTVFVTSGDIAVQALSALNAKLGYSLSAHLTPSANLGFEEMKSTDSSVFVADDIILYSLRAMSLHPDDYEISNYKIIESQPFALVLSHDSPKLQKKVNNALVKIFLDGEFNEIYNKWFLSPVPPDNILINMKMSARLMQDIANIRLEKSPSNQQ